MFATGKNSLIAGILVAAALLAGAGASPNLAHASPRNSIAAVDHIDAGAVTQIRIKGTQAGKFSVYRLERPTRIVIDVAQADLSTVVSGEHETSATFPTNSWAVSSVAAQELEDGGAVVRVVVSLARPGRYDVKASGNDIIVTVTARDPAPQVASAADVTTARAEADAARKERAGAMQAQAAAEQARTEAERVATKAKATAATAQADADRLRAQAKLDADRATRAEAAAAKASTASETERRRIQAELTAARADAARATEAARVAQAQAERAKAAQTTAEQAAQVKATALVAAAEADRRAAADERAAASKMMQQAATAQAEADRRTAAAQLVAAEATKRTAAAQLAAAEATKRAAAAAAAQAGAERERAAAAKAAAAASAARDESSSATERQRAALEAAATKAEARLAAAEAATRAAEQQRTLAERGRVAAEQATTMARGDAAKAKAAADAESQRRSDAEAATARAVTARQAEEAKAMVASRDRRSAEMAAAASRAQADKAMTELQARTVAERRAAELAIAKATAAQAAQAGADAAVRQKASQRDIDAAQAEAKRLATERSKAEADLVARRAAVASGQAQVDKLTHAREQAAAEVARLTADTERMKAARAVEVARLTADTERMKAARAVEVARLTAETEQLKAARAADVARLMAETAQLEAARAAEVARLTAETKQMKSARAAEVARLTAETEQLKAARAADVARLTAETEQLKAARAAEESRLAAASGRRAEAEAAATRAAAAAATAERARLVSIEQARLAAAAAARVTPAPVAMKAAAAPVIAKPAPAPVTATPKVVPAPVIAPALVAIGDVAFRGDAESAEITIAVPAAITAHVVSSTGDRVELVLDGAQLPTSLERKLDVTRFGSMVRAVSSFRDREQAGRVRMVIDLSNASAPRVVRDGGNIKITFTSTMRRPVQDVPSPVMGGYGATSTAIAPTATAQVATGRRKVFRGNVVNFDFKDAPIHDLLRFLSEVGKVNIVIPDEINTGVTVRLKRVPWDQALEVILASKGLWYRKEGNLYRIAPRKEIDAEDEAEAARRAALREAEQPEVEILTLNYASASELKSKLEPMMSAKGKIEVDERTNALIISDIGEVRRKVKSLSMALDTQTPQISIEARIVEARSTFKRQFGIQWGGSALASAAGGNATGLVFPSSVGVNGGADDSNLPTGGLATPSNFAVNLPSTLSGGALGLALGSVGGNFNINLRLSAMEENGTVRIISAPKITVLNNSKASISQGVSIPISVVGAAGTQTQFIPADLSLSVTPYVSQRDCSIAMDVEVSKNEPDFVNTGSRGDPTILKKEAKTKMLVADGETAVLGGIYTRNSGLSYSKLPFLGDLPVIGWLFKRRAENDERTEVLVFITPKITNKAYLRCQ